MNTLYRCVFLAMAIFPSVLHAQAPKELPSAASAQLAKSLAAAASHSNHLWRDTPPTNSDGTVNGYIEIALGDRRKYEFNMGRNDRAIDRTMPASLGGYPVNYGFVPQTVSYDGDPFDVLVLGPALPDGRIVRGVIVGLMHMEDEKGLDSKVILSPVDSNGRAKHELTSDVRNVIGDYFRRYKEHEAGKFSKVPGWGSAAEGRDFITTTHDFFRTCPRFAGAACKLDK